MCFNLNIFYFTFYIDGMFQSKFPSTTNNKVLPYLILFILYIVLYLVKGINGARHCNHMMKLCEKKQP